MVLVCQDLIPADQQEYLSSQVAEVVDLLKMVAVVVEHQRILVEVLVLVLVMVLLVEDLLEMVLMLLKAPVVAAVDQVIPPKELVTDGMVVEEVMVIIVVTMNIITQYLKLADQTME